MRDRMYTAQELNQINAGLPNHPNMAGLLRLLQKPSTGSEGFDFTRIGQQPVMGNQIPNIDTILRMIQQSPQFNTGRAIGSMGY